MSTAICQCGHEKRDHQRQLANTRSGACKVCLCDLYLKPAAAPPRRKEPVADELLANLSPLSSPRT